MKWMWWTGGCQERIDSEQNETVWYGGQGQCAFNKQNKQNCCRVPFAQVDREKGERDVQAKKDGVREPRQMEDGAT
jgi:hypothetical protein